MWSDMLIYHTKKLISVYSTYHVPNMSQLGKGFPEIYVCSRKLEMMYFNNGSPLVIVPAIYYVALVYTSIY